MQSSNVKYNAVVEQHEEHTVDSEKAMQSRRIDWRCPASMYGSLLAGIALAIGHYAFYAHLNGKLLDSTVSQTWTTRIGTAFAFLVKLSFVIAAATAYMQRQWLVMGSKTFKIGQVDTLTSILGNIFYLFDGVFWFRYPLLASMAIITWLIPLAAVVSPGAIIVSSIAHFNTTTVQVPQLQYNYSNFAEYAAQGTWAYQRPKALVSRIAFATATTSQILTRQSPFENNTYVLTFDAPALRCEKANATLFTNVQNTTMTLEEGVGLAWDFIAWVGGDDHDISSGNASAWTPDATYASLDHISTDAARLFVAALDFKPNGTGVPRTSTYECQCWNATYQVRFSSTLGVQTSELVNIQYLNGVPLAGLDNDSFDIESGRMSYNAVMDAFGGLLVGYVFHERHGELLTGPYMSSSLLTSIDWYNNNTISQSMETLFYNLTMSLFSADSLLKNGTSASQVPVDVTTYPLIYVFKPRDLVLAYGIVLLVALYCVFVGTHAIITNGACYRNLFSTYARTLRDQNIAGLVDSRDDGADPLPERVANAKFSMQELIRNR